MKPRISHPEFMTHVTSEPRDALVDWLYSDPLERLLLVDFSLDQWWLPEQPVLDLTAIYWRDCEGRLHCTVSEQPIVAEKFSNAREQFAAWVDALGLAVFQPGRALQLEPCYIAKPWGQEIWFTGVEERGVSSFTDGAFCAPIPWVQAIMPSGALGGLGEPLVLLKVLDPLPEAVTGDLYFELHEEKREVYVVTHVDREAWPDGVGHIRYGFSPQLIAEAESESVFRDNYREAVRAYECIRREIDESVDGGALTPQQVDREKSLREAMNQFTHLRPLRTGDVVVVPLLMPHSLQHGVRTIEFQTPVYERQILSFAQKALTQDHWDTEAAVARMRLQPPEEVPFELMPAGEGVRAERIVDFPDFEVRRLHFAPGGCDVFQERGRYGLVVVLSGELALDGARLEAEQAALLPANSGIRLAASDPAADMVLLLALPRG